MKWKLTCGSLLAFSLSAHALELKNLDLVKQNYIHYYTSGQYQYDQAKIGVAAIRYLNYRLRRAHKIPYAIVLDIDDTSLSNYAILAKLNFGGTAEDRARALAAGNDPVIQPTLELYRFAKKNHVAVFFITGRTEQFRAATERNLLNVGYKEWDGLTCKPTNYAEKSVIPYKSSTRAQIIKSGYDIVLNMGDQDSDLKGGFADKTFKFPNPYYFIP